MLTPGCRLLSALVGVAIVSVSWGDVSLPSIYSDHMVLQRDSPLTIWGWAAPGERVAVRVGAQSLTATATDKGTWSATIDSLPAAEAIEFRVTGEKNAVTLADVAVGDVWLCAGQSNMAWAVQDAWNADLEIPKASRPSMRLVTIHNHGAQFPVHNFRAEWTPCTPESVGEFSAVGYYFGREVQDRVEAPVGLIDIAWGGSTCESWIPTPLLEANPLYAPLIAHWRKKLDERSSDFEQYERGLTLSQRAGRTPPPKPPWDDSIAERHQPGNLFYSRLSPVLPARVRGVIWYQGEANAGRPQQYRELFPLMIQSWREAFRQPDLPFYWSQLPDFNRDGGPPRDSAWAQLREAQTMTLDRLSYTGQAVTIDLGEAGTIHPREKEAVGRRLARIALAESYGLPVASQSPRFDRLAVDANVAEVLFQDAEDGLCTVDAKEVQGFAIAGDDRKYFPAEATLQQGNRIKVWSKQVPNPVAVRYAWANNPTCNLYSTKGLPVTPFRTDDWPGIPDEMK